MIITRTPVRISFGGGGTDLPAYYEKYGGMVVSTTINKFYNSVFEKRQDKRITIVTIFGDVKVREFKDYNELMKAEVDIPIACIKHYKVKCGFNLVCYSDVPKQSGLGGSSAFTVNLVTLFRYFNNKPHIPREIAEEAHSIRINELELPAGKQDEYASAFGGLNFIEFKKGLVCVQPLISMFDDDIDSDIENNILLFYSNIQRSSTNILSSMAKNVATDKERLNEFHEIKRLGYEIKDALKSGNMYKVGKLLDKSWQHKKKLSDGITNRKIDEVYKIAIDKGAYGCKITGAGGGGFMMVCAPKNKHKAIKLALRRRGFVNYPYELDNTGTNIEYRW